MSQQKSRDLSRVGNVQGRLTANTLLVWVGSGVQKGLHHARVAIPSGYVALRGSETICLVGVGSGGRRAATTPAWPFKAAT